MASRPFADPKRGRWLLKYRPDPKGPWVRVTLGKDDRLRSSRPPKTPPQHILDRAHALAEIEYRAKHGLEAAPVRAVPLAGYAQRYAEAFATTHKPGSVRHLRRHLGRFVAFCERRGITTVQGVARPACRDYLEARIAVVSHDTLGTELRYLAPLWARAVEDGLMTKNPWARLKVPGKSTRREPTFWSEAEVVAIADHAARPWQRDLILILANTGLRVSTALAMRWSWVRWDRGVIVIPKEDAALTAGVKTAYRTALNRTARDILERRHFVATGRGDLVFPSPRGGGMISYDTAREAIVGAVRRSGVKPGTPHSLRHTYARILSKAVPANVVQSQVGHASASTTFIYTKLQAEDVAKELEDFGIGAA